MKPKNKRLGVLWSGGKDSCYAALLAKNEGYALSCLISMESKNEASYMFHTPSIAKVKHQAKAMELPLVIKKTDGEKEIELKDLQDVIAAAKERYHLQGIVTGALASTYQASRIQKICDELDLECFNPLWQIDQFEHMENILKVKMEAIITGVFAQPFNADWLGRIIDRDCVEELKDMATHYAINVAGEGGEFESYVLYCPKLFKHRLQFNYEKSKNGVKGEKYAYRMEALVA